MDKLGAVVNYFIKLDYMKVITAIEDNKAKIILIVLLGVLINAIIGNTFDLWFFKMNN